MLADINRGKSILEESKLQSQYPSSTKILIFGMIERSSNRMVLFSEVNRSSNTIIQLIKKHARPGAPIYPGSMGHLFRYIL